MNFITDVISKLPTEIVFPLAIILVSLPIVRVLVDLKNSNRSHNREILQQLVVHLEKYSKDKNKVSAFFIEEAARSRYRSPLLLSEIMYFLEKNKGSHQLSDYSKHKPYVAINEEKISLVDPASAICNGKVFNVSWKEMWGYTSYSLYAYIGAILAFSILPLTPLWIILKWFAIAFFIIKAITKLTTTDKIRDARIYIENLSS